MGIYLIYLVIVKLINKTEIIANNKEIAISHKPLLYLSLKSKRFRIANCKDFYFFKNNNTGAIPGQNYCYEVYVNTQTGADKKLLTVPSSKEADFIEKTLRKYYQIEPKNETEPIKKMRLVPVGIQKKRKKLLIVIRILIKSKFLKLLKFIIRIIKLKLVKNGLGVI